MTEVPRSLDQLTPAWLSGALRAEVATAELTAIAGGGSMAASAGLRSLRRSPRRQPVLRR